MLQYRLLIENPRSWMNICPASGMIAAHQGWACEACCAHLIIDGELPAVKTLEGLVRKVMQAVQ
jgi:hypothetical protein